MQSTLVLLGLCSRLRSMYTTDRCQMCINASSLNAPYPRGGGITQQNNATQKVAP